MDLEVKVIGILVVLVLLAALVRPPPPPTIIVATSPIDQPSGSAGCALLLAGLLLVLALASAGG